MMNPAQATGDGSHYLVQLDGLRAFAVAAVAWSHWMPTEYQVRLPWGHFGVQLFFVLSGFLITRILLQSKESDSPRRLVLRDFYVRRVLRIFPAYFCTLAILWALEVGDIDRTIGWHALYLSNVYLCIHKTFGSLWAHFWTLCVEEQFYLLWPLVVVAVSRKNLARIAVGAIVVAPLFRVTMRIGFPELEATQLMPSCVDALGAGSLLAILANDSLWQQRYRQLQMRVCLPIFVALQFLAMVKGIGSFAEDLRHTTMALAMVLLVSDCAENCRGFVAEILSMPFIVFVGRISYGLYLFHNFMPHVVRIILVETNIGPTEFDVLSPGVRFSLLSAATLLLAFLSWMLIERPFLALKRYFPYPHSK